METAERGDHSDMSTPLVRHTYSPFCVLRDARDTAADSSRSLLWLSSLGGFVGAFRETSKKRKKKKKKKKNKKDKY